MRVYKDKQFLIFEFDDGKNVKYDFATQTSIGKSGRPVKNICTQLSEMSMDDLIKCCENKNYADFLNFVKKKEYRISNIGTILSRVPFYSKYEQFFSAGLKVESNIRHNINDIPKGLLKLAKKYNLLITDKLIDHYIDNPNAFNLAFNEEFYSLSLYDIDNIFKCWQNKKVYYGEGIWDYNWKKISIFNILCSDYGYTAKALWHYLDYLKTFEALEWDVISELYDYAEMMKKISPKFDKYPRHFLTTHKIAIRNYNRLKEQFDEDVFKTRINKDMEKSFDEYTFIYPSCTQDIKDEATAQNNCVASYIKRVIDGECHILFMRYKDKPNESLVTIEVRNGKIVQAKRKFNDPVSAREQEVIDKWNTWYSKKLNNKNESEEKLYGKAC